MVCFELLKHFFFKYSNVLIVSPLVTDTGSLFFLVCHRGIGVNSNPKIEVATHNLAIETKFIKPNW
jgi:hypothetical protein